MAKVDTTAEVEEGPRGVLKTCEETVARDKVFLECLPSLILSSGSALSLRVYPFPL